MSKENEMPATLREAFQEALQEPPQSDTFGKPEGNYPLGDLQTKTNEELWKYLYALSIRRTGKDQLKSMLYDCVVEEIMLRARKEEKMQTETIKFPLTGSLKQLADKIREGGFKRGEMVIISGGSRPKESREEYIARMTGKEDGPWIYKFEGEPEQMEEFLGKIPDAVVAESMSDPVVNTSSPWVMAQGVKVFAENTFSSPADHPLHQVVVKASRIGLRHELAVLAADMQIKGMVMDRGSIFYNGPNSRLSDPFPYDTFNISPYASTPLTAADLVSPTDTIERDIKEERNKRLKQVKTSNRQRGDNARDFVARNPFMKNKGW